MRSLVLIYPVLFLAGCGSKTSPMEDLLTREVTLPGGHIIRAETAVDTRDMMRGLMFRDSLAPDHGMLFVHPVSGNYGYWMYQTNIPLDMIWMDQNHRIVELVENAPPCKTAASKCPHFGGHQPARFVLELNGGSIRKFGIRKGQTIQW
jgi:uncharacterized membrane protein (UPF0127 family)